MRRANLSLNSAQITADDCELYDAIVIANYIVIKFSWNIFYGYRSRFAVDFAYEMLNECSGETPNSGKNFSATGNRCCRLQSKTWPQKSKASKRKSEARADTQEQEKKPHTKTRAI